MSTVFDICAEVGGLLETTATNRDDSHAPPFADNIKPNRLYIWPRYEQFPSVDTGLTDQHRFDIRVAWSTQAERELSSQSRSHAVSQTLATKLAAYVSVLRNLRVNNQLGTTFQWIEAVRVDWESLITTTVRGFYLDLSGYVIESLKELTVTFPARRAAAGTEISWTDNAGNSRLLKADDDGRVVIHDEIEEAGVSDLPIYHEKPPVAVKKEVPEP